VAFSAARLATTSAATTIAILLREHMDQLTAVPRVQLFATDMDERALTVARRALSYGFARQRLVGAAQSLFYSRRQ
jgi:chemotaxis methyl-accepting protein methylase